LYQPGDESRIVNLLDSCYGGWPSTFCSCTKLEHWIWKYLDNPSGQSFVVEALHDDEIVGVVHGLGLTIKRGDKVVHCTYAADLAVHPDHRKSGISNKMYEVMIRRKNESGVAFDYFVTGIPFLIKSWSKRFTVFPFTVTNYVWINDVEKHLRYVPVKRPNLVKWIYRFLCSFNLIRNSLYYRKNRLDMPVHEAKRFDEGVEKLCEKAMEQHDFIIERNMKYLNWRYSDPRGGNYTIKIVKNNDEISGYCVLTINKRYKEYPIGIIVDLLTSNEHEGAGDVLVSEALNFFKAKGINVIICLLPKQNSIKKVLQRSGFIDSRIKLQLFLRINPLKREEEQIIKKLSPEKIHFTYGDVDSLPSEIPEYVTII